MFRISIDEGSEHADASIACGTATKAYDNVSGPFSDSISHQLACTIARCHHRVALFLRQQGQTTGLGNFNHGHLVVQQILRNDRPHQRVSHRHCLQPASNGSVKGFHIPFTPIADRHFYDLRVRICLPDTLSSSLIGLHRSEAPLE